MTIAKVKTKAEQALIEQFEAVAAALPGNAWLAALRKSAIGTFAALGLPHRRLEAWKYTDLRAATKDALPPAGKAVLDERRLAAALGPGLAGLQAVTYVFVNGRLASWSHGPLVADHPGITVTPLAKALALPDAALQSHFGAVNAPEDDAMIALNTAFASDGAVIRVKAGARLEVPVHIVMLSDPDTPAAVTTRNLIEVGAGAVVTLIESHVGAGSVARQTSHAVEIALGEAATLDHVKVLREGPSSQHVGTAMVRLGADATYRGFQFTASPGLARNQSFLRFAGEGGTVELNAAFLVRDRQHVDTTLVVDHAVPRCTSRELIKGVLDGEARGVFQGKVLVRPDAQKSDGKQMARALMLSPAAEFDSKPELEIHADDVVCGHGSTSAELDDEMLFYLRSRGIPAAEARALLIDAFVGEAIDTVRDDAVREALRGLATAWLEEAR